MSVTVIASCLGHLHSYIKTPTCQGQWPPSLGHPWEKKVLWTSCHNHQQWHTNPGGLIKRNRHATASDIKEQVPEVAAISVKHIDRLTVNKFKIQSRTAAQKPLLMEKMKTKRLAFAKKYVGWEPCIRATQSGWLGSAAPTGFGDLICTWVFCNFLNFWLGN